MFPWVSDEAQELMRQKVGLAEMLKGGAIMDVTNADQAKVAELLANPGIVRNRLKIQSAIRNAQGVLGIRDKHGSLDAFLWRYVDGAPKQNRWRRTVEVPARTDDSDRMSKDLKKLGFSFVGSTICYALMQAVGMVNDHAVDCFRYPAVRRMGRP